MNSKLTFTSAIAIVALSLAVAPVGAQDRGNNGRQRGGERASTHVAPAPRQGGTRQAVPRSQGNRPAPAPQTMARRGEAPRGQAPQTAQHPSGGRQYATPQTAPRPSAERQYAAPQAVPRGNGSAQAGPRAVPRPNDRYQPQGSRNWGGYGYAQPRGGYSGYGAYGPHTYVRPHGYVAYRPFYFSRPYYSFRPRFEIGFGIWLGYPAQYPWYYFGSYRPRVYGYYNVLPGIQSYGGLSFDIQPSDADLYVDGQFVGTVGTFVPYGEPLTLVPGLHRIAIVRDGFRTIEFDVTIEAGQVFPYRGEMVRW